MSQGSRQEREEARSAKNSKKREFTGNIIDFTDPSIKHNRVLLVEDRQFYVTDQYLAQWSEFFEILFNGEFKEGGLAEIPIADVCAEDFSDFLSAIYPSQLRLNGDILPHILDLSCRFLASGLIRQCERFMLTNFQNLDPFDVIELAFKYETHLASTVAQIKDKFTEYCRDQLHSKSYFKKSEPRDRQERHAHRFRAPGHRFGEASPERNPRFGGFGFGEERPAEPRERGFPGGHRRRNARREMENFARMEPEDFMIDLEEEMDRERFGGDPFRQDPPVVNNTFHDTRGNSYNDAKEACNNTFLAENADRIRRMSDNCQMFIFHVILATSAPGQTNSPA